MKLRSWLLVLLALSTATGRKHRYGQLNKARAPPAPRRASGAAYEELRAARPSDLTLEAIEDEMISYATAKGNKDAVRVSRGTGDILTGACARARVRRPPAQRMP